MKKLRYLYAIFLLLTFLPGLILLFLIVYPKIHTDSRYFVADLKAAKYTMYMRETEHDTILVFHFHKYGSNKKIQKIFVRNCSWNVISFVFVENMDTIFIRGEMEYRNLFLQTERTDSAILSGNVKRKSLIVGACPPNYKEITFYDRRFFKFDNNIQQYIPKNETTHVIELVHDVERTDTYHLYDETMTDTTQIEISQVNG